MCTDYVAVCLSLKYCILGFDVRDPVRVVLKVYNLLGQEVTTLVDGPHTPGRYRALFDTGGLPSGMYFYQIEMGDFRAIEKMVLLK